MLKYFILLFAACVVATAAVSGQVPQIKVAQSAELSVESFAATTMNEVEIKADDLLGGWSQVVELFRKKYPGLPSVHASFEPDDVANWGKVGVFEKHESIVVEQLVRRMASGCGASVYFEPNGVRFKRQTTTGVAVVERVYVVDDVWLNVLEIRQSDGFDDVVGAFRDFGISIKRVEGWDRKGGVIVLSGSEDQIAVLEFTLKAARYGRLVPRSKLRLKR